MVFELGSGTCNLIVLFEDFFEVLSFVVFILCFSFVGLLDKFDDSSCTISLEELLDFFATHEILIS